MRMARQNLPDRKTDRQTWCSQ